MCLGPDTFAPRAWKRLRKPIDRKSKKLGNSKLPLEFRPFMSVHQAIPRRGFRPCLPTQHRMQEPSQIDRAVVENPQLDIGGNARLLVTECGEEVLRAGVDELRSHQGLHRHALHELREPALGATVIDGINHVRDILPSALAKRGVLRTEIHLRHLAIERGLSDGFIFGLEKPFSFRAVFRAQALARTRDAILRVVGAMRAARAAIQAEFRLHPSVLSGLGRT